MSPLKVNRNRGASVLAGYRVVFLSKTCTLALPLFYSGVPMRTGECYAVGRLASDPGRTVQIFLVDGPPATNVDLTYAKVTLTVTQHNKILLNNCDCFKCCQHLFRKHPVVISQYCSICEWQCALQGCTGKKCSLAKVRQTCRHPLADML